MRTVESVQLSHHALRAIAYHEDRREFAIGASDNNIYILDADSLALKHTLENAHLNSVFSVAWSPDGSTLLSGGRDAWLRVWQTDTWEVSALQPLDAAHLFTLNHIVCSPCGRFFATASRDKTVKIWDAQQFRLLKVLDVIRSGGHVNSVNRLWWQGERLISASDDRSAMIWRVQTKEVFL
jgi:WD40 repeat protein